LDLIKSFTLQQNYLLVGAGAIDDEAFCAQQAFPPAATDFLQHACIAVAGAATSAVTDAVPCPSFLQHAFFSSFEHEAFASLLQLDLSLQHFLSANIVPAMNNERDNKITFFIF
jgi:hypothetical protein